MYLGEDSFFLSEQFSSLLRKIKDKKIKILDLGAGSGIQAETCLNSGFNNVLCADIDEKAVELLREKFKVKKKDKIKSKIRILESDLFNKINKKEKFDLIIFNPPYLPEDKYDKKKDITGGKKGDETILRFLTQSKSHLSENGKILLLLSSLTPKSRINKLIKKLNYKQQKIAEKKLFFEQLEVWLISV